MTNITSATLPGFKNALIGQTSQGNYIYDLERILEKILTDAGNSDYCGDPDVELEGDEDPWLSALDAFWYDMSYYQPQKDEIPFVILDGTTAVYPDPEEVPF